MRLKQNVSERKLEQQWNARASWRYAICIFGQEHSASLHGIRVVFKTWASIGSKIATVCTSLFINVRLFRVSFHEDLVQASCPRRHFTQPEIITTIELGIHHNNHLKKNHFRTAIRLQIEHHPYINDPWKWRDATLTWKVQRNFWLVWIELIENLFHVVLCVVYFLF